MFVRTVARKHTVNVSVQIVESFRNDDGKPRQRIIEHLGSVRPGPALDALRRLAEKRKFELVAARIPALFPPETLAERALAARRRRSDKPLPIADARKLAEEQRLTLGFHEVFGAMYDRLGLDQLWTTRQRVSERVFRQAVLMRLARPGRSKRAHAAHLDREFGVPLPLGKLYRMMDRLTERRIAALEGRIAGEVRGLLDERIEVVFADATTLAFASEVEDDLRRKGYSKDGKPHRVQVVLALLQTEEGAAPGLSGLSGEHRRCANPPAAGGRTAAAVSSGAADRGRRRRHGQHRQPGRAHRRRLRLGAGGEPAQAPRGRGETAAPGCGVGA